MANKALEQQIADMIGTDISALGYDLVRVQILGGGQFATLQIMAERLDEQGITVEDCTKISHAISERLDADKALADKFTLEVSSPGIDRPLVKAKDYERFKGHMAKVELDQPLDGIKGRRFQASIVGVRKPEPAAEIEFRLDTGAVNVPISAIQNARLVLTDALLKSKATKH